MKNTPENSRQTPPAGAAATIADGAGAAAHNTDASAPETNQEGAIPQSTQEDMGDGSGIRGGYGNSDQTNGLEGGDPEEKSTGKPAPDQDAE